MKTRIYDKSYAQSNEKLINNKQQTKYKKSEE